MSPYACKHLAMGTPAESVVTTSLDTSVQSILLTISLLASKKFKVSVRERGESITAWVKA